MKLNLGCGFYKLDGFVNVDKFANCEQGLYAESETREVPVNSIRNVLTLDGQKKTASVVGSIYRQWDALCNAIK